MESDDFTRHYIIRYLSARELVLPPLTYYWTKHWLGNETKCWVRNETKHWPGNETKHWLWNETKHWLRNETKHWLGNETKHWPGNETKADNLLLECVSDWFLCVKGA